MTKEDFEKARYLQKLIAELKRQKNNVSFYDDSVNLALQHIAYDFGKYEETLKQDYGSIIDDLISKLNLAFEIAIQKCEKKK